MKIITFFGTCSARSELTIVSQQISTPFVLRKIHMSFGEGCNNLMQISVFTAPDNQAPTTGKPNGVNAMQEYGQVNYIVGDGDQKDVEHEVKINVANTYIKVYANNTDYYDHDVDVIVTVEPTERR